MNTRTTPLLLALLLPACGASLSPTAGATPDAGLADAPADTGMRGRRERCNGIDDDLDGRTDEGCPIRLTRDPLNDIYPSLSGHRVAWQRQGDPTRGWAGEFWVHDLATGVARMVARDLAFPALSGHRLAGMRERSGVRDYVVIDLDTGVQTVVTPPDAAFIQSPVLVGDLLAWSQQQQGTEEDFEVYVHDLATGRTTRLAADPTRQEFPRVEGRTVVFSDDRLGHHTVGLLHLSDVFAVDLASPTAARAVSHRSGEVVQSYLADFNEGRVLLSESHGPLLESFTPRASEPVIYEVATGRRTSLAPAALQGFTARALWGRRAVVELDPEGVSDLYLVDVPTLARTRVTDYPRHSTRAKLQGNDLVWQDDRNDHWDIYYMDLSDADRGDLYPEGVSP